MKKKKKKVIYDVDTQLIFTNSFITMLMGPHPKVDFIHSRLFWFDGGVENNN